MSYKVIQWAPGYVGNAAMKYVIQHPMMELVGVKCFGDSKAAKDAGEICGLDPIGVYATKSEEELLDLDADCVIFTCGETTMLQPYPGTMGYEFLETICRLLESGKNVVATTPMHMLYPKHMGNEGQKLVDMLNLACERGNSTVLFTGYEPGFMGDAMAALISSISMDITEFRTYELVEWSNYDKVDSLKALGVGVPPGGEMRPMVLEAFRNVWATSIYELADMINIELDELRVWDRPQLAEDTFTTAGGVVIEKGTVAVNHWAVEGMKDGVPRIAIEHCNRMRSDLAPELPSLLPGGGYRVEIQSNQLPLTVDIHSGRCGTPMPTVDSFDAAMYGAAARAVNSIEAVCKASPGFKTKGDLPPITGRNAMWL
ncbi:hypothetical protein HBA55_04515 [Pseudomaricurvus alkylphenolicus]|uniref:hypothetical protein n=1 Tax=Pseudomaricurvus alkylphenolicus TaxID=1306991 RepID=UPI00141F3168|nr:hypothetical protein [Pseudomaricurvus alkylphenolicus]NIB38835.1 hypothetical protein [Pseudomaricurvus alkylphenolicus]